MNAGHPVDYKLLQYPVLGSTNTHMINLLAFRVSLWMNFAWS